MDTRLITKIIRKFLEGDCSDEEFAYLLYWYESFDENPAVHLEEEETVILRNKILARVRRNIPELRPDAYPGKQAKKGKVTGASRAARFRYAAAAAVVIMAVWAGISYYGRRSLPGSGSNRQPAVYSNRQPDVPRDRTGWQSGNLVTLDNHSNRIHYVMLPDSSEVWLSPHSRIEYPEAFVGKKRQVRLRGEAFFDIHTDPGHPFIVTSGDLITRVLGTSFLLKAYSGKPIEVAVMTGKVAVSRKDRQEDRITLTSNQKAVLSPGRALMKIKDTPADLAVVQRWQKVNLSFNNIPFLQVARALENKFDVHIQCRDKGIYQYSLNADFNDQNLMSILEMLEKSLNIHYEMANDSVINFYKAE